MQGPLTQARQDTFEEARSVRAFAVQVKATELSGPGDDKRANMRSLEAYREGATFSIYIVASPRILARTSLWRLLAGVVKDQETVQDGALLPSCGSPGVLFSTTACHQAA